MIESYVKTKEGRERITAYDVNEVQLPLLTFKDLQRNHKIVKYATDFAVLDTETSHSDLVTGWIYQWAVKIKKTYIYGRTPEEIIELLIKMAERYKLSTNKRLIIYIHNSSYDLQYLKHYLRGYDPTAQFLAIDAHSILICDVLGFRIICSYKLTNLSLAALSDNYSDNDWFYMFSDVAAQHDGVTQYLKAMGYTYAFKAPFTSTGFVRTDCRKAALNDEKWREEFTTSALNLEQYNLARWAFMGGVCIASFLYSGQTVRSDKLRHKDFTSSYPARQMLDYFPEGAPSWYGDVDDREELQDLLDNYCCIFVLTLSEVHIKEGVTAPCIPSSKCVGLREPVRLNGKIVYAKELSIAVTELDYKWIAKQYTAEDIKVSKMMIFKRGKIPDWLKDEVYTYFKNKCTLKELNELLYNKSKAFLNAIYGMTATAILRPEYELNDDCEFKLKEYDNKEKSDEGRLNKYYHSYNSFMPYQYACYTTAWARDALFTMIETVGYENFLYCDTDSVFYIETPENKIAMEEYAEHCRQRAIAAGAYVDNKFLGEPTDEPPLRAFRALHAKCYAMEEYNKKTGDYDLKVVIAGIPKKSIKWVDGNPIEKTNSEELGSIDKLKDGFKFSHCGGTRCVYNEAPIRTEVINGHKISLASSAVIDNIEKEISDTMWSVEGINLLKVNMEQL